MSKDNIFFPNTTQVPNFVFDVLMAKTSKTPARFFVLLAIIRKTYGWQKHEDLLSLSQIIELTGMAKPEITLTFVKHPQETAATIHNQITEYKAKFYSQKTEEYKYHHILDKTGF